MLYEQQDALTEADLVACAQRLGLDAKLIESARGGHFAGKVERDLLSGVKSGINGTPSLFLNGKRYDGPRDANSLIARLGG
jgi:protein-disulfide isomerase